MNVTDVIKYVKGDGDVTYSTDSAQLQTVWAQTLYYVLQTRNQQSKQHVETMAKMDELIAAVKGIGVDQAALDQAVAAAVDVALANPPAAFVAAIAQGVRDEIIRPDGG